MNDLSFSRKDMMGRKDQIGDIVQKPKRKV